MYRSIICPAFYINFKTCTSPHLMSFVAAIDQARNKTTWSRAVIALASVLDHIQFSISSESLTLSAVNSSRTTHGEIVFDCLFFRDYAFHTSSIMREGYLVDSRDSTRSAYSFIVSSKHMVVLFKNLDSANLSYICLQADFHEDVPITRRYKLLVEVLTKKLIVKKYQMNYQPVSRRSVEIPALYKQDYEEGNARYLRMDTATLKLFFDMVPVTTEDFRIDVKAAKILFGAYTKQILKDREYLKQPMLITILMAVDELMDLNLGEYTVLVSFRLKDFRNFINLCTHMAGKEGDEELEPDCFELFFKTNGDPIVFEHKAPSLVVRFIQITADDAETVDTRGKKFTLPAPVVHRISPKKPQQDMTNRFNRKPLVPHRQDSNQYTESRQSLEYDDFDSARQSSPADIVTYGKRASTPVTAESLKRARVEEDTDYGTSDEEELGPTQANTKPKSLFD